MDELSIREPDHSTKKQGTWQYAVSCKEAKGNAVIKQFPAAIVHWARFQTSITVCCSELSHFAPMVLIPFYCLLLCFHGQTLPTNPMFEQRLAFKLFARKRCEVQLCVGNRRLHHDRSKSSIRIMLKVKRIASNQDT